MKAYRFIRRLTPDERTALAAGLGSDDAFVLRRCQIVLGSADREPVPVRARRMGRTERNVQAVLDAFEARGLDRLRRRSSQPQTIHVAFPPTQAESLKALLHHSPRTYGKPVSVADPDERAEPQSAHVRQAGDRALLAAFAEPQSAHVRQAGFRR